MYLQELIEVGIGLVFAWLVLSIANMQIQEWIGTWMSWRAKYLENAVRGLLADPNLAAQFYDHPLIRGLIEKRGELPSYIPANKFALALFDTVTTAGTEASLIQRGLYSLRSELNNVERSKRQAADEALDAIIDLARRAASTQAGTHLANVATEHLKQQVEELADKYPQLRHTVDALMQQIAANKGQIDALLLDQAVQATNEVAGPGYAVIQDLHQGIMALSVINPDLRQSLTALLLGIEDYAAKGENALAMARTNVEGWFNDSMDRLTGWYKRNAQNWAFVIGFVLALIWNVDSVEIATKLWREPTIRQVIVAQAEKIELPAQGQGQNPVDAVNYIRDEFSGLNLPIGWTVEPASAGEVCGFLPGSIQVPGYYSQGQCNKLVNLPPMNDGFGWFIKLAGIIVSGAAAAQGAPLWFDILKKLINVRGAGANPAEKKAEG
jgi:hypothetical protein